MLAGLERLNRSSSSTRKGMVPSGLVGLRSAQREYGPINIVKKRERSTLIIKAIIQRRRVLADWFELVLRTSSKEYKTKNEQIKKENVPVFPLTVCIHNNVACFSRRYE